MNIENKVFAYHPCFSEDAQFTSERIHLPIAKKCNMTCSFCHRQLSKRKSEEQVSFPGQAHTSITNHQALLILQEKLASRPNLRVIGVSGPGDPLMNDEVFEFFHSAKELPGAKNKLFCLCTNGILLNEKVVDLVKCGINSISITINSLNPHTFLKYNRKIVIEKKAFEGAKIAKWAIKKQLEGLSKAVQNNIVCKINIVYLPGINNLEIHDLIKKVVGLGAHVVNIVPLLSSTSCEPQTLDEILNIQNWAKTYTKVFTKCQQCQSDACGVIASKENIFENVLT